MYCDGDDDGIKDDGDYDDDGDNDLDDGKKDESDGDDDHDVFGEMIIMTMMMVVMELDEMMIMNRRPGAKDLERTPGGLWRAVTESGGGIPKQTIEIDGGHLMVLTVTIGEDTEEST